MHIESRLTVELVFDFGHEQWTGRLFLPDTAREVITLEDVLTPLNDDRAFLPVAVSEPPFVWLINKGVIHRACWQFEQQADLERHVPWDRRERVRLYLAPEASIAGYLVMMRPQEGLSRVQDFLNLPTLFIPIIDQQRPWIWFASKRWITRIGHVHD